jgi:hypothetical protein
MAYEKGRQQYLAVKQQSPRLTPATSGFVPLFWDSIKAEGNKNVYREDTQASGRRGAMVSKELVGQSTEFGYDSLLDADQIIYMLFAILGAGTPTTALGATSWTLTVNQILETPMFTIQYRKGDKGHKRVVGFIPNKITFDVSKDDIKISVEGKGIKEEAGTTISVSYPTLNKKLLPQHFGLGYADSQALLASSLTALSEIESAKFTIENGGDTERHQRLGSLNPANNTVDGITASLEFTITTNGSQATLLEGFHTANTQKAWRFDLHDAIGTSIGTSALKPRVMFDLPPSSIEMTDKIEKDDLLSMEFKCDVNFADAVIGLVQNSVATVV